MLDYATEQEIARVPVGDHPQRVRVGVVKEPILGQARAGGNGDAARGEAAAPDPAAPATQARTGLPATGGPAIIAVLGLAALGAATAIGRRS